MNKKIEEIKAEQWNQCVDKLTDKYPYLAEAPLSEPEADDVIRLIASHERLEKENGELRSGENDWWQRRWINKDIGEQLFEIRKKWLTAYQCAENYQKMYEDKVKELKKLQRIVACADEIYDAIIDYGDFHITGGEVLEKYQQVRADYDKEKK